MLSIFPIQFLAIFGYFIIRICVALILIHLSHVHFTHRKQLIRDNIFSSRFFPFNTFSVWFLCTFELIVGTLLFIGLFTQIAALLTSVFALKALMLRKYFSHPLMPERLFFVLLLAVSLSLCITGAGAFAIDLPI